MRQQPILMMTTIGWLPLLLLLLYNIFPVAAASGYSLPTDKCPTLLSAVHLGDLNLRNRIIMVSCR